MNSVVLIGRLTRDPEVRYISERQMAICDFYRCDRQTDKIRTGKEDGFSACYRIRPSG